MADAVEAPETRSSPMIRSRGGASDELLLMGLRFAEGIDIRGMLQSPGVR